MTGYDLALGSQPVSDGFNDTFQIIFSSSRSGANLPQFYNTEEMDQGVVKCRDDLACRDLDQTSSSNLYHQAHHIIKHRL